MKPRVAWFAVGLLVAGCAGQATRPPDNAATRIPESGGWFCQLSPSGQGWSCVQDPELAEHPAPERLPQPEPPVQPPSPPEPSPLVAAPMGTSPADTPLPQGDPSPRASPEPAPEPSLLPGSNGAEAAPKPAAPPPSAGGEHGDIGLARDQAALMVMPGTHYTVQLIAMKTREELDQFVRHHGLGETLTARVEREGELYYVLLLGVYEGFREAEDAVAGLPPVLRDAQPWIRPLRSLQLAMARARTGKPSG